MGMTFSNAAVKSSDLKAIIDIASAQAPVEAGYEFKSFYLFPPINGWSCILAPGDHPANSFSLASAAAKSLGTEAFAHFTAEHSGRAGYRFLKTEKMISAWMYDSGEYQGSGDLESLATELSPSYPDSFESLASFLKSVPTREAIMEAFSLPWLLGSYGFEYVEELEDDGEELEDTFGEGFAPQRVFMQGYDN